MAKTSAKQQQQNEDQQNDDLDQWLAEEADAIRAFARSVREDVIEIGRRLSEVHDRVKYGAWLPWLKREFNWSRQTADNYIGLYRAVSEGKLPNFGNFDLSALFLLSKRSTPDSVRRNLVSQAAHRRVSHEETKRAIEEHHAAKPKRVYVQVIEQTPQEPQYVNVELCPDETAESRLTEELHAITGLSERLEERIQAVLQSPALSSVQQSKEREPLIEQLGNTAHSIMLLQQALAALPLLGPPEMPDAKTKH
jgi:hypothetical protein